ncbi:MAG: tyrosine recombinase XerC [Gammaproteobacteria bacterium]
MAAGIANDIKAYLGTLVHRSSNTRKAYQRDVAEFESYLRSLEIEAWHDVDANLIRHYVTEKHRAGAHGRSLARVLSALRSLFKYLCANGTLRINPAVGVRPPKGERKLPRVLDVDQMSHLLEQDADKPIDVRDRAMWELLYSSGLRVSELVGLDLADLDLEAGQVRVLGKGSKERDVPVGRHALAAVRGWLGIRRDDGDAKAMFLNQRGKRLTARAVQQRLRQWARRYGVDGDVHPHMLRHSFASHMLESSGDLRAVQELLGHANISTTQVYTHLDFQHLAQVYDAAHPRARKRRED